MIKDNETIQWTLKARYNSDLEITKTSTENTNKLSKLDVEAETSFLFSELIANSICREFGVFNIIHNSLIK